MCGIVGCLALAAGAEPHLEWVRVAAERISHRGPDDDGFYIDTDIALGFKRLAIIDLSAGGHQPMRSADGRYCMVFNGEIYNYVELGNELQNEGVHLRTDSDSEVLLEAYARYGKDVVRRLRGMFAFAIWDTLSRELFCARDPFGIKPFYYVVDEEHGHPWMLRFGSERKALAEAGELHALDRNALRRYLCFQYVPAPQTLTLPVMELPPGHAMTARPGGGVDVSRYWRADLRPARAPKQGNAATILETMRDSVAVHLRSDAPLGAFLSGGIDSAAICALAAEHKPDLLTFTVGFEREGYSEIEVAQDTAASLGVTSLPYVISADEFFANLPRIIWHLDDPMADAAAVPLWFVAREASRYVKVVLSGEGSDELFGGYRVYQERSLVRAGERLPDWGRTALQRAAALIPRGVKGKAFLERMSTPLRRRYLGNAHVYADGEADAIVRSGAAPPRGEGDPVTCLITDPIFTQAEEAGLDDVSTKQLVDINTWLAGDILVKADRMTMAHSLELRVPYLDPAVMAVAARLARQEKIGAGTTKVALRQAMRSVLPKDVAERAKLGFPVPIGHWLNGEAGEFADRVLREAQTDEWIDRAAALRLLQRFRDGRPDVTWRQVWVLIVFSLWHQIYVERVYDPVALGWEPQPPAAPRPPMPPRRQLNLRPAAASVKTTPLRGDDQPQQRSAEQVNTAVGADAPQQATQQLRGPADSAERGEQQSALAARPAAIRAYAFDVVELASLLTENDVTLAESSIAAVPRPGTRGRRLAPSDPRGCLIPPARRGSRASRSPAGISGHGPSTGRSHRHG
jgi:asparagine synthase (glutamine-hydrolysing)